MGFDAFHPATRARSIVRHNPSVAFQTTEAHWTRSWRIAAALSASLCLASCATPLPDDIPEPDESRARDIIAVIDVVSTRFYERNGGFGYRIEGEDGQDEIIYASDPPFRVGARVVVQLYGPPLDRSIHFKTHSHWGTRSLGNGNLKLVHLLTDGNVLVEPDESDANVGTDIRGRLFVPVYPYPIHFLPCGLDAFRKPVMVRTPADRFGELLPGEPMIPTPPDIQKRIDAEVREYYRIAGKRRYPKFGIPVDDIAKLLKEKQPAGEDFGCFPP